MHRIALSGFCLTLMAAPIAADVNLTTSRFLRTEYMCRVAMENGLKPVPAGLDHFRLSKHQGVADLYGDGTIDFFFGFSDDTFDLDRLRRANETRDTPWPIEMFFDNAERSSRNHQYSFYSPDPDFVVPDNTRFLVARTFAVQDYNGDGIDDFAVAQYGRDYPPAEPRPNELFLSGEDGYQYSVLPGGSGKGHGATAGDIDNDGDVDLVISRTEPSRIMFFENDGTGTFRLRDAAGVPSQSRDYAGTTLGLWDIDGDGYLDLITSRRSNPFDSGVALIFWGRDGFSFDPQPNVISVEGLEDTGQEYLRNGLRMPTAPHVLDFEFADFDGDGADDIVFVTEADFYRRWQITVARIEDRTTFARVVDRSAVDADFSIFWITACDLRNDGRMDLLYEHFGQHFSSIWRRDSGSNQSRMERYVWLNDGTGGFNRYLLESPVYFPPGYRDYLAANAEWLGVASEGYLPTQVYFPNVLNDLARYVHPFYEMNRTHNGVPFVMVPDIAERFPSVTLLRADGSVARANDPSQISPRVAAIIEERQRGHDLNDDSPEVDTPAGIVPSVTSTVSIGQLPAQNTPTTLSPRAQAALDAIRRGEDPYEALEGVSTANTLGVPRPSVAQPNDPAQVSDRVREIIEERRGD